MRLHGELGAWATTAVLFLLLPYAVSCGERPAAEQPPAETPVAETAASPPAPPPDTTGAALWAHLQAEGYRDNWATWPGKGKLYKGQEPHGMLLTTYLNPIAYDALTNRAGTLPPGAIIVKENYAPDSTLAAVTTMYKVRGYNSAAGDWFWVKQDPTGAVDMEGKAQGRVEGCIGCHGQRAGNDYIFTGSLK